MITYCEARGIPPSSPSGVSSVAEIYDSAQVCKVSVTAHAAERSMRVSLRGKISISNNISKES